jgi:hypothetical protein
MIRHNFKELDVLLGGLRAMHDVENLVAASEKASQTFIFSGDSFAVVLREENRKLLYQEVITQWSKLVKVPAQIFPFTNDHVLFVWSVTNGKQDHGTESNGDS